MAILGKETINEVNLDEENQQNGHQNGQQNGHQNGGKKIANIDVKLI